MTTRLVLGGILLAAASAFGVRASVILFSMIDEVNDRLPEHRKIRRFGAAPIAIATEYKRLFPGGGLAKRFWTSFWICMACLAASAWPILFG